MNKPSDNMIAECLLKTIGAVKQKVGSAGRTGTGPIAAREWLTSIGLDPAQLQQVDGSGLSRQNYVSPHNLVKLLQYWTASPQYITFFNSLPIAGVDGTLRNRMKGTPAANNCHAKTGSLSQVSSLSGYVTSKDGVPLVFSIMINNQIGTPGIATLTENSIVELLAGTNVGPAGKNEVHAQ
jgi:D-alanyl-D-alanine carboxypeptidase/D-alanyl-D-alanine-endopeptidase (penicillin-binding protein 4)